MAGGMLSLYCQVGQKLVHTDTNRDMRYLDTNRNMRYIYKQKYEVS
jgi:hypothetical protein